MSFSDKLKKLEIEKKSLVEKRLFEIARIVEKADILGLDNNIIIGALLLAKEAQENQDVKLLDDYTKRAKKMPSRRKSVLKNTKEANS